jgi:peptidyl-prolyl cis-trans isomerase C
VKRTYFLLIFVLPACHCGDGSIAKVGDTSLFESDVAVAARARDRDLAIDELIETTLLAEAAKRRGLDRDDVKARADSARRQVLANALLDDVVTQATTDAALHEMYASEKAKLARRRVHVAHIVVRKAEGSDAKMSQVLARLRAGDKFDVVARDMSEDTATAARGGALASIDEGRTDPAFFDAAVKLRMGETSDVVSTPFGFHVIYALSDPLVVTPTFAEAKGELEARAMRTAKAKLLDDLQREIPVQRTKQREAAR